MLKDNKETTNCERQKYLDAATKSIIINRDLSSQKLLPKIAQIAKTHTHIHHREAGRPPRPVYQLFHVVDITLCFGPGCRWATMH